MRPRHPFTALVRLVALLWLHVPLLAAGGSPSAALARQTVAAPAGLAPERARALETLSARLEAKLAELHLPGLALAIVADDELVFARGFGFADLEARKPVTSETLFAIGSTSKAFTATLVAMLADDGRLSFDDPVTKALPWFTLPVRARSGETLTFRDLLAHRTGFVRMDMLWHGTSADSDLILRTALGAEPIAPFRREFHYNNVMYLAAGRACEELAGASWGELIRARFFEPLGMKDSSTRVTVAQQDPRLALGYAWDARADRFRRVPMRDLDSIAPAGAINSNVLDLSRWVRFLLGRGELEGRRLVSEEALAETWKRHNSAGTDGYGLGWFLRTWRGQPYVEHGGNIDGFAAQIALLPQARIGAVLLTNVGATSLQGTIGPDVFAALLDAPTAGAAAEATPGEDLSRYAGTYLANYYQFHDAKFEVKVQDGHLAIDIPGQMLFELLPPDASGKRPFKLVPAEIQAEFFEEDGRVVELRLHQGGMRFDVPRPDYEPPAELDPAELEPYLGSYADPASGKTFAVVVSRNRLALDYPEQMVYELFTPGADERWVFRATPQMAVEFHLDADGRAESLTFHERGTKRACERQGDAPLALPSLAELLELRRAARFEERLAALGVCRLSGTMRFVHCGIEGPITTTFDPSGASLEVVDLRPFLWTQTACDGTNVRVRSSAEPEQELAGARRDHGRTASPAFLFGDWSRRFGSAAVERVDEAGGKRTARVKLTHGEAPATIAHVDLESGDLLHAEVRVPAEDGSSFSRQVTFEDWRELDGLRLPMRMVTEDPGLGRVVVEYAELATHLDASDPFALPEPLPSR